MLTLSNFKCDRYCGECCKKTLIPLRKEDISRIKKTGLSEREFVMPDPHIKARKLLKKQENGWCIFLRKTKHGVYNCEMYKNRPWECEQYPFFTHDPIKSCLPQKLYPNVFFSQKKQRKRTEKGNWFFSAISASWAKPAGSGQAGGKIKVFALYSYVDHKLYKTVRLNIAGGHISCIKNGS